MSILKPNKLELANSKTDVEAELLSRLGAVSRKHREALGLSTAELSISTEIPIARITQLELGDWDIDLLSLHLLSLSLNTTTAALLEETDGYGVLTHRGIGLP